MDKGNERSEPKKVEAEKEECSEAELESVQGTGQASVGLSAGATIKRQLQ